MVAGLILAAGHDTPAQQLAGWLIVLAVMAAAAGCIVWALIGNARHLARQEQQPPVPPPREIDDHLSQPPREDYLGWLEVQLPHIPGPDETWEQRYE